MNENRHSAGSKKAGVSMGGKFAAAESTEATGVGLLEESSAEPPKLTTEQIEMIEDGERPDGVDEVLRAHVESLPSWERELVRVNYDEQLFGEQIDRFLAGDSESELYMELDDIYWEHQADRSEELAAEILEQLGVEDPKVQSESIVEELAGILREHDTSDVTAALAKNTHPQLMRASLSGEAFGESREREEWVENNVHGFTRDELYSGGEERSTEARVAYVTDYLARAGVQVEALSDHDRESINDLVVEGPYYWHEGVRLDAIWYGNITDAAADADGRERRFTLGGAPAMSRSNTEGRTNLVLLDTVNGSGYEASFDTPFTITVTSDRPAMLDSGGSAPGYGWDDTAGVVKSYYAVGVQQVETTGDEQ